MQVAATKLNGFHGKSVENGRVRECSGATVDTQGASRLTIRMMARMYQAIQPWRSEFVRVRTLRYHVQVWGDLSAQAVPLFMLHGWMDVAASFQFVVDALPPGTAIIAPDWRGFGQTAAGGTDSFWFPDYLADLEWLLNHFAPQGQVDLLGHSMGANVAMLYAGIRPQRVRRLINLEGFGMPDTEPEQAPQRYARWLDQLQQLHDGDMAMRDYDSLDAVARRLIKTNPRLVPERAAWLAQHWARETTPGQWRIQGDAAHRLTSALRYQVDDALAVHRCIAAPTLLVQAAEDTLAQLWRGTYTAEAFDRRIAVVPRLERALIENAGHMLHHDQPQAVAALIARFLGLT